MPSRRPGTEPPAAPRLALSVQAGDGVDALPAPRAQLRRWATAAIERDCVLALRFVGEDKGRALNRAYRGRDYATNVLTFEYGPPLDGEGLQEADGHALRPHEPGDDAAPGPGAATPHKLGKAAPARAGGAGHEVPPTEADIVICLPVVEREARAQGKALRDHLAHLVVHGVLHAQGWDHERGPDEAARMEARERAILARFRIPDPYAEP